MAVNCKGAHFPPEVILMGIRWYVAYPLSTRHVEERMDGFFARSLQKVHSRLIPPMPVEPGVGPTPARSHAY